MLNDKRDATINKTTAFKLRENKLGRVNEWSERRCVLVVFFNVDHEMRIKLLHTA